MAQRFEIQLIDDLDGSEADGTVRFGVDSRQYEIDLSAANRQQMAEALRPYIENARKVPGRRRRSTLAPARHDQGAVREWARAHGIEVSARGRLPLSAAEAYDAAHSRQ
ncbi:MAG TPA: Lsr2 family protein [Streptosporangiaceae bacterium]|nr:Lsr2 family protein [Streptosporangiaceae bacterium]